MSKRSELAQKLVAMEAEVCDFDPWEYTILSEEVDRLYKVKSKAAQRVGPDGATQKLIFHANGATWKRVKYRVRFLKDTVHPDYGQVKEGEVLEVDRPYVRQYEELGIAEETRERPTRWLTQ
jgi:hypothetical protein